MLVESSWVCGEVAAVASRQQKCRDGMDSVLADTRRRSSARGGVKSFPGSLQPRGSVTYSDSRRRRRGEGDADGGENSASNVTSSAQVSREEGMW